MQLSVRVARGALAQIDLLVAARRRARPSTLYDRADCLREAIDESLAKHRELILHEERMGQRAAEDADALRRRRRDHTEAARKAKPKSKAK